MLQTVIWIFGADAFETVDEFLLGVGGGSGARVVSDLEGWGDEAPGWVGVEGAVVDGGGAAADHEFEVRFYGFEGGGGRMHLCG